MSEKKEINRSELVRLRRERENKQRMQRAVVEATRTAPVKTRANSTTKTKRKSGRTSNARRFQVALLPIAPDTELRGFSISRPRLGQRLPSFLLVALLGTVLYLAFNLPQLRVSQAQVLGNQMLSREEINSTLKIAGQPIFLVVPAKLETQLRLQYPEFVSVKVDVALPNTVSIYVHERKPVIRWEQGGSYAWISEDGVAFRPRGDVAGLIPVMAVSAPPTEGNVSPDPLTPAPFISSEMVQAIKGLAGHVPPGMTISYDPSFGFGWTDPRGWRVYFVTSSNDV